MRVEQFARSMIGTPWVHQGRNEHGVDCVGLCVLALRDSGIEVRDRTDYGQDPDGTLRAEFIRVMGQPHQDIRPGDMVIVKFRAERHAAIVSSNAFGLTLIHADSSHGRVVEHNIDDRWRRRIVGAWRLSE